MDYSFTTEGHTFEFRSCPTGSIDPWSLDYARENNIHLVGTSDFADFILIDGDTLYKLRGYNPKQLEPLMNGTIQGFDNVMQLINKIAYSFGFLKESIEKLNKLRNDIIS